MNHTVRRMMRAITVVVAIGMFAGAGTAAANGNGDHSHDYKRYLQGGHGAFQPLPSGDPKVVQGCGTTLTITEEPIDGQIRITPKKQGQLIEVVGSSTYHVVADDGREATGIDDGDFTEFDFNDGSFVYRSRPNGLNYALSDQEEALYASLGLPDVFLVTKGKLVESYDTDGNATMVVQPRAVFDICAQLGAAV